MSDVDSTLDRIVKGAGISFVGLIFAKLLNYVYRFIISRAGPEAYGIFSLATAITGFLVFIALLGLQSGAMRYVALYSAKKQWNSVSSSILSCLRITGTSSILVAAALFISAGYIAEVFHTPSLALALRIFAIYIPFESLTQIVYSTLLGFKRIRYYTYSLQIISPIVKVVLVLLLMFFGYGLYAMIGSTVLSTILTFFVALYFLEVKVYPFLKNWRTFDSFEKELLRYSIPLGLSGFVYILMTWTDTLFLGYFRDAVAVGIYNVAVPTAQLLYILPTAFNALFAPLFIEAYGLKNKNVMDSIYKATTRWNVYFNIPMLFMLVLFSPSIIRIFFGAEYVSGYIATSILSFSVLTNSVVLPATSILVAIGRTREYSYGVVISYLLSIILNVLLIPAYGLEGAAFATLISSMALCIFLVRVVWKHTGLNPFSGSLLKSILAAVLSIYAIYAVSNYVASRSAVTLLAFAALYFVIYLSIMLLLGAIVEEDKMLLKRLKNKINFLPGNGSSEEIKKRK